MSSRLVWERDGLDWPNREASRFVRAAGLHWHVQILGRGPVLLLVHGTGGATHSWRDLAPGLAAHFTVVAPDLPGHGFTGSPAAEGLSLPGVARRLCELLRVLGRRPVVAVGHSAGAAILCRMSLDGTLDAHTLVSLNGALLPLRGAGRQLFSPLARLLVWNPLVPWLVAWRAANPAVVRGLIRDTGSCLEPEGIELYARLARSPRHVAAALGMMANWDLKPLARELPGLEPRLLLVVGENDRFVAPGEAERVRARVSGAEVVSLPDLGHLAHEEQPGEIAGLLTPLARPAEVSDGAA